MPFELLMILAGIVQNQILQLRLTVVRLQEKVSFMWLIDLFD